MNNLICYPVVPLVRKSFKGSKKVVLPNQSMSLQEILRRFVRREALPIEVKAGYFETDYDLEKVAHMDIAEKHEILERVKAETARRRKIHEDAVAREAGPPAGKGQSDPVPAPVDLPPDLKPKQP